MLTLSTHVRLYNHYAYPGEGQQGELDPGRDPVRDQHPALAIGRGRQSNIRTSMCIYTILCMTYVIATLSLCIT